MDLSSDTLLLEKYLGSSDVHVVAYSPVCPTATGTNACLIHGVPSSDKCATTS